MDRSADRLFAFVATLTFALLYFALPNVLIPSPAWVPLLLGGVLELALFLRWEWGKTKLGRIAGFAAVPMMAVSLMSAVAVLVYLLPRHPHLQQHLLISGVLLWLSNILVFTLWYWRFDGGGPTMRPIECDHSSFLFPQMVMSPEQCQVMKQENWQPQFIDYLFLAFTMSTALSPTDTPVLGRAAKLTAMLQSLISVTIIVVLIARAVNIMPLAHPS